MEKFVEFDAAPAFSSQPPPTEAISVKVQRNVKVWCRFGAPLRIIRPPLPSAQVYLSYFCSRTSETVDQTICIRRSCTATESTAPPVTRMPPRRRRRTSLAASRAKRAAVQWWWWWYAPTCGRHRPLLGVVVVVVTA